MRRLRYSVAVSLDGYIADEEGGYDWIVIDPDIDFAELFADFDTMVLGRKTYELMKARGDDGFMGMKPYVLSTTLEPGDHDGVTVWGEGAEEKVRALLEEPGKDVWLFGGGILFQRLLAAGLVSGVEVAVIPTLLGGGIPMLPTPSDGCRLTLVGHRIYEKTGTVFLEYAVETDAP